MRTVNVRGLLLRQPFQLGYCAFTDFNDFMRHSSIPTVPYPVNCVHRHGNHLNKDIECVWSSIQLPQSQNLYLWSFYQPAGAPLERLEQLEESLTDLHTKCMRRHPNAIIAGDFNVGDIAWDTHEVSGTCGSVNVGKLVDIKEHGVQIKCCKH